MGTHKEPAVTFILQAGRDRPQTSDYPKQETRRCIAHAFDLKMRATTEDLLLVRPLAVILIRGRRLRQGLVMVCGAVDAGVRAHEPTLSGWDLEQLCSH